MTAIQHPEEGKSNAIRGQLGHLEPKSQRTFTPTQAVLASSAGSMHWTPEGKPLYDFTSGVLVANLGHNPVSWMRHFNKYMGWNEPLPSSGEYFRAVTMTAYNGVTPIEIEATQRLLKLVQGRPGGARLEQAMWAASGSEAIQKALWAAMAKDRDRSMILATRNGFHGKKGLANAVTGSETDTERDPRVKFFSFPTRECADVSKRDDAFDPAPYEKELDALWHQYGRRFGVLITEPYLGGGGSYHPHKGYLQMVQAFCRKYDIVFILDEVQANFGRTGDLFAYETYGLEPDMVVLGKGLGNGVPVAAVVGRKDIFAALHFGEGSDTWSANPLQCASVLATIDAFEAKDVLGPMRKVSAMIEAELVKLKKHPWVAAVRGEQGGMVWGVEMTDPEHANAFVLEAYRGEGAAGKGVHLLGPLAKKVVRVSPPLVISMDEAADAMAILARAADRM